VADLKKVSEGGMAGLLFYMGVVLAEWCSPEN
jgi:hypothetical protein